MVRGPKVEIYYWKLRDQVGFEFGVVDPTYTTQREREWGLEPFMSKGPR